MQPAMNIFYGEWRKWFNFGDILCRKLNFIILALPCIDLTCGRHCKAIPYLLDGGGSMQVGKTSESVHCTILNKLCACQRMRHRPSARPLYRFGRLACRFVLHRIQSNYYDADYEVIIIVVLQRHEIRVAWIWWTMNEKKYMAVSRHKNRHCSPVNVYV